MTKSECEAIRDMLVDYADGDLPDAESTTVRGHVDRCEACRTELSRLQASLKHAQTIWQQSATAYTVRALHSCGKKNALASATVAAVCIAMAIAGGGLLLWSTQQSRSVGPPQDQAAGGDELAPATETTVLMSEIESLLARETRSARLAASSQILASMPALTTYRKDADEYLATTYENSHAGRLAAKRLDSPSPPSDSGT